jgi:NAD(P)H-quinone oxidoreductase subunit 4
MGTQLVLLGALLIGFGIKIPLVPFHTWLPDAHTEASTPVSVLLAGVLLKLGTYGLLRFGLGLFPQAWALLAPWLAGWAAVSVLYGSLAAIAQRDMKRMVAYSSVGHMGYVLLAAAAATPVSLLGAVFQMVSHGLISALLFLLVGAVYQSTGTRDLEVLRGLLNPERGLPLVGSLMIMGVMASAGCPAWRGSSPNSWCSAAASTPSLWPPCCAWWARADGGVFPAAGEPGLLRSAGDHPTRHPAAEPPPDIVLPQPSPGGADPALALTVAVVAIGLVPAGLGRLSETATTAMSHLPALVAAMQSGGIG